MPAWPAYARIEAERRIRFAPTVERTEYDDGAVRQARRFTAALVRRTIRAWLASDADLARFRT